MFELTPPKQLDRFQRNFADMFPVVQGCHSYFHQIISIPDGHTRAEAAVGGVCEILGSGMLRGPPRASTVLIFPLEIINRMPATETDIIPDGVLDYGVMEYDPKCGYICEEAP